MQQALIDVNRILGVLKKRQLIVINVMIDLSADLVLSDSTLTFGIRGTYYEALGILLYHQVQPGVALSHIEFLNEPHNILRVRQVKTFLALDTCVFESAEDHTGLIVLLLGGRI